MIIFLFDAVQYNDSNQDYITHAEHVHEDHSHDNNNKMHNHELIFYRHTVMKRVRTL